MVFIKQTVRIDKVSVQTADFLCLFIHHIRKCFQRAATDFVCQHNRSLICRWKHDCIEQLFYGKCFSQNDTAGGNTAAVGNVDFIDIVLQLCGKGDFLAQIIKMFQRQDCCHDFGKRCWIFAFGGISGMDQGVGGELHHVNCKILH